MISSPLRSFPLNVVSIERGSLLVLAKQELIWLWQQIFGSGTAFSINATRLLDDCPCKEYCARYLCSQRAPHPNSLTCPKKGNRTLS